MALKALISLLVLLASQTQDVSSSEPLTTSSIATSWPWTSDATGGPREEASAKTVASGEFSITTTTTTTAAATTLDTSGEDARESPPVNETGAAEGPPTETAATDSPSEPPPSEATTTARPSTECPSDSYCLNGGTCVLNELGQMTCICPEEFYGARCQTRNICKTIITDSLTGDQICGSISRECLKSDRFFRCQCHDDEYFVFKTDQQQQQQQQQTDTSAGRKESQATFAYDSMLPLEQNQDNDDNHFGRSDRRHFRSRRRASYLAECRKIDMCLGVRCRQMSEVCLEGACRCNQDLGYSLDPADGLCKLLDLCRMPTSDGSPICGQAKCVATYDRELYRCLCPIGYKAVKVGEHRNSTQCVMLTNLVCEIPLLNKCQHLCKIDRLSNSYKCSCLPGYHAGERPGFDDHLCFFDEHLEPPGDSDYGSASGRESPGRAKSANLRESFAFRLYETEQLYARFTPPVSQARIATFGYDHTDGSGEGSGSPTAAKATTRTIKGDPNESEDEPSGPKPLGSSRSSKNLIIKREPVAEDEARARRASRGDRASDLGQQRRLVDEPPGDYYSSIEELPLSSLSAQDRCNLYCEENKICVLEEGSKDSYRCVCERQGFVSIGDRCLDWCSAAEFNHSVASWLEQVCYSGACEPLDRRPSPLDTSGGSELDRLVRSSSWRPSFTCDCSSSPLLSRDPETNLCKLNFREILRPCLPGNEGHTDCVQNKNAYCAVLHRPTGLFFKDLLREQPAPAAATDPARADVGAASGGGAGQEECKAKKLRAKDKLYTCVCSPEKKFLVDKPRNKARCIDECDLLNNECGRFNRMCRSATIEPEEFGRRSSMWNLVRLDRDGFRMNQFKRTGCECLPGFNVGPSESLDFTFEDPDHSSSSSSLAMGSYLTIQDGLIQGELASELGLTGAGQSAGQQSALRTKYMNINSRCLLDYDVVEFHASFKAPADFEPSWLRVRDLTTSGDQSTQPNPATPRPSAEANQSQASNQMGTAARASKPRATTNGPEGLCSSSAECLLKVPAYMRTNMADFHKSIVLVAQCDSSLAPLSLEAYRECVRYRYWILQKLRNHFADWRRVLTNHLKRTFDLMEGSIRLRVNKCEASIRSLSTISSAFVESMELASSSSLSNGGDVDHSSSSSSPASRASAPSSSSSSVPLLFATPPSSSSPPVEQAGADSGLSFDPLDQYALVDADVDCELTIHSASDGSAPRHARKVLLEKQLPRFIFNKSFENRSLQVTDYYLMAPNVLIQRESFDQLAKHRKLFSPCKSDYAYCDKQTRCEMVDTVNFSCTCEYGYTPIGSRDIYQDDSRKEVCEDIDECLFDVCKENGLENKSICINEIGDYKCQCIRHHVGDNKRYCNHICNIISCKYGDCRIPDEHHAYCECFEGYREADCSVQDPSVALRKANMIICGSIFTSVLLLAITLAISLNSQLKKTKKKLKRLEAANEAAQLFELPHHQPTGGPFRSRLSKVSVCS